MEKRIFISIRYRLLMVLVCPLLLVLTSLEGWAGTVTLNKSGTGTGTVTSLPIGINCGPICSSQSFSFKTTVTLVAVPAATKDGSKFSSWTGCTPNVLNPRECTVSASSLTKLVYAKFDRIIPTVELKGVDTIAIESTLNEGAFVVSRTTLGGYFNYPLTVRFNIVQVQGVTNACSNVLTTCVGDFSMYAKVGTQIVKIVPVTSGSITYSVDIPAGATSQTVYIKPIRQTAESTEGSEPVKLRLTTMVGGSYNVSLHYYETTIWVKDYP